MISEGYMKMLEDKWKDKLPTGYKLKFVESVNEDGKTVLTPQIVKELANKAQDLDKTQLKGE